MNKLISKIVGVGLGLALATGIGAGVVLGNKNLSKTDAAEEIAYTLNGSTAGSGNSYAGDNTATQGGVGWTINGNLTTNPWRIGGKSITNTDRLVKSNAAVSSENISKVDLTVGAASNITVNSLQLLVGTSSGGSQTSTVTGAFVANSTITFSRPTGADWTSKYFTFDFNVTVSGSSNKFVEFKSAVFYYEASSVVTYTVTYDGNGNSSGNVPSDSSSPYASGSTVTVLGNSGNLAKTDYTFNGWNTAANGSGTSYSAGDTFTINTNTTLFAQWLYAVHYTDDTTAKTITWDLTMPEYTAASATQVTWESPKATMVADKADASSATNNYLPPVNSSSRFYKNSTLTISPVSGYRIDSVVAQATSENYANALSGSAWTNATASVSTTAVTIVPTDKTSSFVATLSDTVGLSELVVHYSAPAALTSIAVSGSMTNTSYSVGDNWDPTGLIVTATYADSSVANVTTSATWSYSPATANATSVTSVTATASYTEGGVTKTANSAAQTVTVSEKQGSTDVITIDNTSATGTSYVTTTGIAGDTAVYTSHNAHANEANGNGLQYRSNDSTSGIVSTTSGGLIESVTITYAEGKSGQIDVYGKNTAYAGPADLYNDSTKGTLLGSVSSTGTVTVSGDYKYVGVRSNNGARYLTSIEFVWGVEDTSAPKITIDQTSSEQVSGDTGTLTATTENAGTNTVAWTSSDATVVSINETTGAWQAKKIGAATITATLGSTGKFSTITITVTGNISVAEARTLIDGLGGGTSEYKVTVAGYVISFSGDGTKNKSNSITIADAADGTDTFQIYFGYAAVSNWAEAAVAGAKISAKGNLTKYNTTYEMTSPTNVQVISADKAAVQDFVRDYMHMNDYDPSLDNSQGTGACNGASGYYMAAKGALTGLTETQISLFQSDSEFDAAQARYEAWANAYGDNTPYAATVGSARMLNNFNGSNAAIIVLITAFVSITFVGGYFLLRKKKEN